LGKIEIPAHDLAVLDEKKTLGTSMTSVYSRNSIAYIGLSSPFMRANIVLSNMDDALQHGRVYLYACPAVLEPDVQHQQLPVLTDVLTHEHLHVRPVV
jgi:hypothetical protein